MNTEPRNEWEYSIEESQRREQLRADMHAAAKKAGLEPLTEAELDLAIRRNHFRNYNTAKPPARPSQWELFLFLAFFGISATVIIGLIYFAVRIIRSFWG